MAAYRKIAVAIINENVKPLITPINTPRNSRTLYGRANSQILLRKRITEAEVCPPAVPRARNFPAFTNRRRPPRQTERIKLCHRRILGGAGWVREFCFQNTRLAVIL